MQLFSKTPVLHPDDLRKLKVFTGAGSASQYDLWKSSGFNPVALEAAGIPQGLLSGTISAVPTVPFFALAAQLDSQAKYMLELNWAPLVGAAVVQKKSWDKVPPKPGMPCSRLPRKPVSRSKRPAGLESDAAVAAMVKRGLKVQPLHPKWSRMASDY